jgi:hypothetical protein
MSAKYTYSVESYFLNKWTKLFTDSRDFCSGYLTHAQYSFPRNAMRIVRSDGKVVFELPESEDVSVGMIASWPTPEQYERAAERALKEAARIREFEKRQEDRRAERIERIRAE